VEKIQRFRKTLSGWYSSRIGRACAYLCILGIVGCGTIKKAGVVATAAGTGAIAGTVLSGGALAPMVGATTTAFVADVITAAVPIGQTGKETMNNCAPDNFWSLLGSLVEMGGWALILIVVAPMILGWILPGPLEKKKKS